MMNITPQKSMTNELSDKSNSDLSKWLDSINIKKMDDVHNTDTLMLRLAALKTMDEHIDGIRYLQNIKPKIREVDGTNSLQITLNKNYDILYGLYSILPIKQVLISFSSHIKTDLIHYCRWQPLSSSYNKETGYLTFSTPIPVLYNQLVRLAVQYDETPALNIGLIKNFMGITLDISIIDTKYKNFLDKTFPVTKIKLSKHLELYTTSETPWMIGFNL